MKMPGGSVGARPARLLALGCAVALLAGGLAVGTSSVADLIAGSTGPPGPPLERSPNDLPLAFVENRGQWPESVQFAAHKGGVAATFARDSMNLHLGGDRSESLRLMFENALPDTTLHGEGRRSGTYNFFVGGDPTYWRSDVGAFAEILYRGLYDGVDVRVRENAPQLEYDVLLDPGADLDQVLIRAHGARSLHIAKDGAMVLGDGANELRQAPPLAWEVLPDGARRALASRFRVVGRNSFGFEVRGREPSLPLVIDPGLDWATYLGGSGDETIEGLELAGDGSGDVIVAGQTWSPDFTHTAGNHVGAGLTPYVARLGSNGSSLKYATFYGGTGNHSVQDVAVNSASQPVVVGDTNSVDFPTTPGAFDREGGHFNSGDYDAYVVKFNATGGLSFGTYLSGSPGTGGDVGKVAAYDSSGQVIVAGTSGAADFPRTNGAYPGSPGVFVSRFDPTGSNLTYSAYIGPGNVFDMVVDPQGFVTIAGQTSSTTWPTTADAYDRTLGSQRDTIVARLKLDGAGAADLKYSTYLGGDQWIEAGNGIAFDPSNPELITVSGFTRSGDFPTTFGALLRTHFAPVDTTMGYLTRFRLPAGGPGTLVWSTLYGGPGNQSADDVAIDATGAPIVTGGTAANNPPTSERAYDRIPGVKHGIGFPQSARADAYVARISADGSRILYSTLLGASSGETSLHVAHTGGNAVVLGGLTTSTDFPVSATAFDRVYATDGKASGGSTPGGVADDAFIARLTLEEQPTADTTAPPAPDLVSPPTGSTYTVHHMGVAFDWTDVSDPSGIDAYHVQLSPNPEFRNDFDAELRGWFEPWTPTSVMVKGFNISETGTWYWRVQALDGAGNLGPWSAVRTVVAQDATPPAAPVLTSPPNNGRFAPGNVTFAWQPAARAKFYELQVDTTSSFTNANRTWVRAITGTQHTVNITAQRRHWWRVRASNDSPTPGAWSATRSFEIKSGSPPAPTPAPAPSPTGTAPASGETFLSEITLAQDLAFGSGAIQGTATLSAPAPAGGAEVPLEANYPNRITVPPSVTIPGGATSVNFTVTPQPGPLFTGVFVTGRYGGMTQGRLLHIYPAEPTIELNSFTVGNNNPLGGSTVQGTLSLIPGWTAGEDGAVVTLASTDPSLASVPDRVTIAPGANSATFTIQTQPVTDPTKVTILASRSTTKNQTLQLMPPGGLASLAIDPKTVIGGDTSQGTVTLSGTAPAGGSVVTLSSNDTTVATVPANVTVPAGSSSATFAITTKTVCCQGHFAQITASLDGVTKFETINVNPAPPGGGVSTLTLSPTSVTGGSTSQGTVRLTTTPSSNVFVSLTSSDTSAATVPASVTVPGGSIQATFTVSTSAVTATKSVTITASAGGTPRTATLTVNPGGSTSPPPPNADTVSISRAEYDSGKRELRVEATSTSSSATLTVSVTSSGAVIGTLRNDGGGRYSATLTWSTNPQNITVKSNLGGSASRTVTLK